MSSPLYLNHAKTALDNLQLMGHDGAGAYTTEAEALAKKAVIEDNYGMKKGLCITAIVSTIALAIILGAAVAPLGALVIFAVIIPIGVWISLASKHNDLEELHKHEQTVAFDIIGNVAKFLKDQRDEKITLLKICQPITYEALRKKEIEFDAKKNTHELIKWATNAETLISTHYNTREFKTSTNSINALMNICSEYSGSSWNEYKSVVVLKKRPYENILIDTEASRTHPYSSVIKTAHTHFHYPNYVQNE